MARQSVSCRWCSTGQTSLHIIIYATIAPSHEPKMVATGNSARRGLRLFMSFFMSGFIPMPKPTKSNRPHSATKLMLLSIAHEGRPPLRPANTPSIKNPTTIRLPFIAPCLLSLSSTMPMPKHSCPMWQILTIPKPPHQV